MVLYNSATMLLLLVLSSSLSATMANVEYGQDGGSSPSPTSSPRPTTSTPPTATSTTLDPAATYAPTTSIPTTTTADQHGGGVADGMMMQISTSETIVMGTGKYYLDLETGASCVRDCSPKGTADCGGIVENAPWLEMFDGIEACCTTRLSWVGISDCTAASVDGAATSSSSSAALDPTVSPSPTLAESPTVSPSPTEAESPPTLSPSPTISRSPAIAIDAAAMTNYSGPPTYSLSPSFTLSPSMTPTTASPTVDMNPNNTYCSANFWEPDGGDCGIPCPSGLGFAYGGTECTSEKPNCISRISTVDGTTLTCTKSHRVGVPTKWCGVSLENTTTCHKPCPNGTDAECDNGELCWGDSPCALIEKDTSKLWCARSYKHLVEHCPKPCPGGTDTECGLDEDNVTPMKCFNMEGNATDVCKEEGAGIREPVDPDNLWCGSTWNNVLETCGKKCPEGTDEECGGNGALCYDLTGNDVICETEGVPVKVAGDPMQRYCGSTYNAMMQSCPKACPNGDECDVGQICFEESPCEAVGEMAPGYVELDTTKMFCGEDYEEAATTGEPCPEEDCPEGQTCWADVERYGSGAEEEGEESDEDELDSLVDQMNSLLDDLEDEGDKDEADESETEDGVDESDESEEDAEEEDGEPEGDAEEDGETEEDAEAREPEEDAEASEPEEDAEEVEPEPAESDNDSVLAESSEPPPVESANPPPAADSSNPPPAPAAAASEPAAAASEPATETDLGDGGTSDSPQSGIAVDNLRMALFGIPTLSTIQLAAWEYLTAIYFEEFYNDSSHTFDHIRDSVSDVSTTYDVTSLNVATGRRRLRRTQDENAFLLTYTQTTQHSTDDDDIGIEQVVRHPFQDSLSRDNYVAYLKGREPNLFGDLTGVSAVMIPVPFEERVVNVADSSSPADEDSSSPTNEDSSSPADEDSSSPISDSAPSSEEDSAPSGGLYGENFYCHNSGEACPTGDCSDSDLCMFVPDGEYTPIAPYSGGSAKAPDLANSAANLVDSALAESTSPQDNLSSDTYGPTVASPAVSADSSTSTSACNICTPTQVGINGDVIFNGKTTKCAEAYDFMAKHYKEGERNCIAAHAALGSACCRDAGNEAMEAMTTDYVSVPVVPEGPTSSANTVSSPSSPASSDSSTSTSPCSLCRPNQVGIDNDIIFNGAHTKCAEAFDFMSKNFKEGAPNCIAAHEALGSTCCRNVGLVEAMSTDYASVPVSGPSNPTLLATTTSSSPDISSGTTPVPEFPSNSYYCGGSMNEASRSCQIPCPTSKDSDCPGNLKCFGNTECQNRGSFFCGTSWFDASDKCSKQCPSGDALECDPGEGCFAWTSCAETASFYCGTTFEDASANCTLPCPSMSEDSCPQGQGCFQYTTCQATIESKASAADSYKPPSDYFCGESKELASMTCSIACPSGKDSECPGDLNCYDGTGCSIRDSFWCGPSWMDAAQKCTKPCSSGSSDECAKGESCYTQTGCQANMFFCGDSYETASCDKPCESRSSDECDEGQKCFAFVKDCALEGNASPLPLTQSLSSGVANTAWGVGHDVENPPDWQTKWIAESSSSWKRSASLGGALFASCSLLLSMLI